MFADSDKSRLSFSDASGSQSMVVQEPKSLSVQRNMGGVFSIEIKMSVR